MVCPVCGKKTIVVVSATFPDEIIYFRECTACDYDFYTAERDIDRKEGFEAMSKTKVTCHLKPTKKRKEKTKIMNKEGFKKLVADGINRGKTFMVVKIETAGNPAPEIIVNQSDNFSEKLKYYNSAYNDNMELIRAKESGKSIRITDVLMTSNLTDLNWFAY